jgi:pimeloyl-ACP methyl ester carboxylesterase
LEEALQRFEREAVHGVCATGRYHCPYFTWGTGPPLLFLHGLGDLACSYVPVISALAKDFRCIAYEQPTGDGDEAQLGRYTHDDLVRDLFALLDELGMRQSYVFGSSFGSTIALAAMRTQPERIPRAILAGGFAQRLLTPAEGLLARVARHLPGTMAFVPFRKLIGKYALGPHAENRPEYLEFFVRTTAKPPLSAMGRRALMLKQLDLRASLPEIRQPVLLVCGECDAVVRRDCEEVLLQALPHCTRVELPECGHMAHYSHPEAVAELVRWFLTPPLHPRTTG